ncbi:VWA domain-containing protein [Novispirillum itersonii]|uniref:VWA domain-containing protein n=1 Tax=Novispirillum itersonii TaxID=189 RepID=UPI000364061B|nr:VWA domain-containing protein [Novispirillum itersonii]
MRITLPSGLTWDPEAEIPARLRARIGQKPDITPLLEQEAAALRMQALRVTADGFPFEGAERDYAAALPLLTTAPCPEEVVQTAGKQYLALRQALRLPDEKHFWQPEKKPQKTAQPEQTDRGRATLLAEQWRRTLDQARMEWELEQIRQLRESFLKWLETTLDLLDELQGYADDLGLDPGILLDLSKGSLTRQQIDQFRRWAGYLRSDPGVRSLCDMLGRLRQAEQITRMERAMISRTVESHHADPHAREEIVGIRLSRDIEHALPEELALLSDPDTALLFDLKFVEARLMCFDMQGLQGIRQQQEVEEENPVTEDGTMGPMILCIDTSGSMAGSPETIAKAVALFLASKAREQKRACHLITFSTDIRTFDFSEGMGMDALLDFLALSFHGGTDAGPALSHALKTLETDTFQAADVLMISDFVMAGLPGPTQTAISTQRTRKTRFYALTIGNHMLQTPLRTLFDAEWIYDPDKRSVQALTQIADIFLKGPGSDL